MTGLPAALSALALASTARVADSVIAAIRREMRRSAGEAVADGADSEETAVMGTWCQRRAVSIDSAPETDVGDRRRGGELDALPVVEGRAQVAEQPLPGPQQHGDDGHVQLVQQSCPEVLPHGGGAAAEADVGTVRRGPGPVERGLDALGHEVEGRAAG